MEICHFVLVFLVSIVLIESNCNCLQEEEPACQSKDAHHWDESNEELEACRDTRRNTKMAPTYKLTYFDLTALGEPIRWLLSLGKVDFEDVRVDFEKDWDKLKPTTPYGKLPILEVDGKVLHQSAAICRYLAREFGYLGKTSQDQLQADIIVDTITDLRTAVAAFHYDSDPVSKEAKKLPAQKESLPFYLSRLDKTVKENNGTFVNGQITWADIFFVAFGDYLQFMSELEGDILAEYSNLTALKKKILALPEVAAWVAKRPAGV